MQLSGINKVEDLHHNKYIEDKGEVSRVDESWCVGCVVLITSVNVKEPTTANSPTDHSIQPLILWMAGKFSWI